MANLIIKSSADNLVLQGSDASPAITVGATGTTTFAENATLSGTANNLGTTTAGTLSSGVTFPSGHILQIVYGVCKDRKAVGNTPTYVIDIEFATKAANSTFFAVASVSLGGATDAEGYFMGLTLSSGATPATADYIDRASSGDSNVWYNVEGGNLHSQDFGNNAASFSVGAIPIVARKETTHAAGATLSAGLWVKGDSTCYINRSNSRATHEGGITTLMVYEMATGSNIVDVTDGDAA